MTGAVYVFLEAVALLMCLNALYGRKLVFDKYTVGFIIFDCAFMTSFKIFDLNQIMSLAIYAVIALYCIKEFGRGIKQMLVNMALLMVIMTCMQISVSMFFVAIHINEFVSDSVSVIIINSVVFLLVWLLCEKVNIHKFSLFLQRKEILIFVTFVLECGVILALLINAKNFRQVFSESYIIFIIFLIFIMVLCLNAVLYKAKYQDKKSELEAYKTYSKVFEELITDIRVKQHEFDNHVNALCNLHYACSDYDELVEQQSQYAKDVVNDNKFNKLLSSGNPVLSGFLYGRLRSIENMGINVTYRLCLTEFKGRVPVYIIIELIGNLLNNAVDALHKSNIEKRLYIECVEEEKHIRIVVRNTSEYIPYEEIGRFFERGYSSKGEKRGLGLYHVKEVCDKYNISLICVNRQKEGFNWFTFELHIKK